MGNDKYNLNGSFTTMHLVFDGVFFPSIYAVIHNIPGLVHSVYINSSLLMFLWVNKLLKRTS